MINVILMGLPCKIKAVTTRNEDGSYTIVMNSRLSYEQQRKSYLHELKHIYNNDFSKENVNIIECDARKKKVR